MQSFRRGVLLVGIPVSALLLLAGAAVATVRECSAVMYAVCGAFALTVGGFLAALYHCRLHRHKGLLHGFLCGLAVTAFWFAVAWMINGHAGFGCPVPWGILGGMCGGIRGVNLPAPAVKKQSHAVSHMRQRMGAFADACRKQRYRKPWQEPEKSTSCNDK